MKFSLRDLLWLLLVVAIAASWFADRRRQAVEVRYIQETHTRFRLEQQDALIRLSREHGAALLRLNRDHEAALFRERFRLKISPQE